MGRSRKSRSKFRHYGNVEILKREQVYGAEALLATLATLPDDQFKLTFDGREVEIGNLRIRCFRENGLTCAACGLKGKYFALEEVRSPRYIGWAIGLYAQDAEGREVYFTKDHIFPSSKGGPDVLTNLQTMCWPCNQKKGDTVPQDQSSYSA